MAGTELPLHPATVHWPFSFLSLAFGIDAIQPVRPLLPATVLSYLPAQSDLSRLSYYALTLGVLTAVPAVVSGVTQALQLVGKQGLYESDGKSIKPKFKTLSVHALTSDVVVVASAYTWWFRTATDSLDSRSLLASGVAALLGLMLVFTAHLGGKMTYVHGMGLSLGKKNKTN